MSHAIDDALKQYFGFNSFRPKQRDIVDAILNHQDTLAILPTGSGKSLCYQLPAVILPGLTLVVSPLIALMQDQVHHLTQAGIKSTFLNSSLSLSEQTSVLNSLDQFKLLYIAPERLANEHFMSVLDRMTISLIVVDEAHCISQWGHAFRPDYRMLSGLKSRFNAVQMAAFTATATGDVKRDICDQLALQSPFIAQSSFNRENLEIRITEKYDQYSQLDEFLGRQKEKNHVSGIIYVGSRRGVEKTCTWLQKKGIKAGQYHAGLSSGEREATHRDFLNDEIHIIVATVAFGMGIHKPDIRFVFHLDMPKNLENYYQEIGRAGRDGSEADCMLLFSTKDLILHKRMVEEIRDSTVQQHMKRKTDQLFSFCHSVDCRRVELMAYFGEVFDSANCQKCDNCMDDIETVDGTLIAQKILSCVFRLSQRFGIQYVCDVLVGAKSKVIKQRRHEQLTTYGLLREMSKLEIRHYVFSLINKGYLTVTEDQYPVLKLTEKSRDILFESQTIEFKKREILTKKKRQKTTSSQDIDELSFDPNLYEILRVLRLDIAKDNGLSAFMVFSNRTLKEMAAMRPQTELELLDVNGIGQRKLQQFGALFLSAISKYVGENPSMNVGPIQSVSSSQPTSIDTQEDPSIEVSLPETGGTLAQTLALFNHFKDIDRVAAKRGLSSRTIITHIAKLIARGDLKIDQFVDYIRVEAAMPVIRKTGVKKLTPIKETLGDDYSWDDIILLIGHFDYVQDYILQK